MTIDPETTALDTPGCRNGQVFLDSAGSSLAPARVADTVVDHLRRETEIGGYRAAAEREEDLEAGYSVFAELLGCAPEEIAFTDSATRSWFAAFRSIPLKENDRILITEVEYGGNAVAMLRRAEAVGASVEVVPSDPSGEVSPTALRELLDERVRFVSLVHAPTNGGLLNPVREVVDAAHDAGALVLLDGCQSVGQISCRADETGADFIAGTGRKWLRGPRGTGFLYARRSILDDLILDEIDHHGGEWTAPDRTRARDDAKVFELWESSIADRLGLIEAARYALELGVPEIREAVRGISGRLREGLARIEGVRVHDLGVRHSGIVTFDVEGVPAPEVVAALARADVTVTVSREASTRIDMERRGLTEIVRASPHYFVTPQRVDRALELVEGIVRGARNGGA
ncbi:aminotransferase class V-fold PLP-dependent enzyme [Nocardiopsis alba]|uniref:Probable hercynylcysteine sulfoxide lyase n=1 Tax=Nocardiopsis alba TaxID=53437 RepID=A0ABV5DZV7_9ACTN